MDNRRLTISSEEQIGEALMRVSNTLEAQRLTKSLEYQEKIRRRTAFRMVLSIILFFTLLLLLIVGGLLLYVLWKYMDPILQRLLPFLEMVFRDFGTIWRSLVESSTYIPSFLDKSLQMMDELLKTMQNMHGIPLKEMLYNINNILATTNGMLAGVGNMMAGAGETLATMGADMHDLMNHAVPLMDKTGSLLDALHDGVGVLGQTIENMKLPGGTFDKINGALETAGKFGQIADKSADALLMVMNNYTAEELAAKLQTDMETLGKLMGSLQGLATAMEKLGNIFG